MELFCQYAVAATREAIEDAGLLMEHLAGSTEDVNAVSAVNPAMPIGVTLPNLTHQSISVSLPQK